MLPLLVLACAAPEPLPDLPATDGPEIQLVQGIGLRDWVATVPGSDVAPTWTTEGRDPVLGHVLDARQLWPGETWTVTAELEDGTVLTTEATVPEPPGGNVLVVLVDDVGVDKVSAYGAPDASPTPTLDRLAEQGVRFDRAYAAPVCSPTRAILLSGRHARRTGVGWIADTASRDYALPYETLTIPEALWDARSADPYTDAAVGKWHLAGPQHPDVLDHPNASGFAWFSGLVGNPRYAEGWGYDKWEQNVNGTLGVREGYLTSATIDDAIDQVEALPEPWFLYVALNAPHTPWTDPPPELIGGPLAEDATDVERYDAVLRAMDTELRRLVEALGEARDRTTIIVMGDNGTPSHAVGEPRDPERQKHSLFEGGVNVPLIVTGPHVAEPGSTSEALVHVADVFPTVAHIAGVPLTGPDHALVVDDGPEPRALDGRSWLPLLANPEAPGATYAYLESFLPHGEGPHDSIDRRMVTDGRFKLMRNKAGEDAFYAIDSERIADPDGPDLLVEGLEPADAIVAWARLAAIMDELDGTLAFEGR